MKNCLYCYEPLDKETDFHQKCSLSFFGTKQAPLLDYTYSQMDELAKQVVERSVAVPGVQAKLSMSLIKQTAENSDTRLTVVGALGGNYIFKPPSTDYPEMPANEHLTMCLAEAYGINVVPSSLIRLKSGELSYITKRIDRTPKGDKIHMLDMFQITEAFDKYRSSMEKVGKAIGDFSQNTLLDKLYFFELTLFSFLTGNNDMHLKNFSMITTPRGWMLSPAYDLLNVTILNPDDREELALTLNGKKRKLNLSHFEKLANELGLTERQVAGVYRRFKNHLPKALQWIDRSFLSEEMKLAYKGVLKSRYERMF
jgi:serine/threonine-protein kinase HipA